MDTTKRRIRVLGQNVATINGELLDYYRKCYPAYAKSSDNKIVRSIIEESLICHPIENKESIQRAKDMAKRYFFNGISDFVEYIMHKRVEDLLPTCKHCAFFECEENENVGMCRNFICLADKMNMCPDCTSNEVVPVEWKHDEKAEKEIDKMFEDYFKNLDKISE